MSVQSEINRIKANVSAAYAAVEEKGGDLPDVQNSGNLEGAVRSIPTGVTSPTVDVIQEVTQEQFDALSVKNPATLYLVKE